MKFVVYARYTGDRDKVLNHRPAHRDYMRKLLDERKLALAGPYADDSGGLLVYEVDPLETASQLAKEDPFSTLGVFEEITSKQWSLILSDTDKLHGATSYTRTRVAAGRPLNRAFKPVFDGRKY